MQSNIIKALTPERPKDIELIRQVHAIKVLNLTDIEVEHVWQVFSTDLCAGWMMVNATSVQQFIEWLEN